MAALFAGFAASGLIGFAQQTIGNLSVRSQVGPVNHLITGFVVGGVTGAPIVIRGIGPSLAQFGVVNPLKKPVLTLYNSRSEVIAQNIGWSTRPVSELASIKSAHGAFGLADNSDDCGFSLTLDPGLYTVQLSEMSGASGIGLLELYNGNGFGNVAQSSPHLINISGLCTVASGEAVAIAGMVLPVNRRILIRAIGPALGQFGVVGALANPKFDIVFPEYLVPVIGPATILPARVVASNDDWNDQLPFNRDVSVPWSGSSDEIRAATLRCRAFPLPEGSKDAAMLVAINHYPMTVQVSAADGVGGVALIEIYDVEGL